VDYYLFSVSIILEILLFCDSLVPVRICLCAILMLPLLLILFELKFKRSFMVSEATNTEIFVVKDATFIRIWLDE
jgi:predicted histidine transporter YuiF (NhaC family)